MPPSTSGPGSRLRVIYVDDDAFLGPVHGIDEDYDLDLEYMSFEDMDRLLAEEDHRWAADLYVVDILEEAPRGPDAGPDEPRRPLPTNGVALAYRIKDRTHCPVVAFTQLGERTADPALKRLWESVLFAHANHVFREIYPKVASIEKLEGLRPAPPRPTDALDWRTKSRWKPLVAAMRVVVNKEIQPLRLVAGLDTGAVHVLPGNMQGLRELLAARGCGHLLTNKTQYIALHRTGRTARVTAESCVALSKIRSPLEVAPPAHLDGWRVYECCGGTETIPVSETAAVVVEQARKNESKAPGLLLAGGSLCPPNKRGTLVVEKAGKKVVMSNYPTVRMYFPPGTDLSSLRITGK